jgi:Tfp pilus assembly protein FimT
MAAVTLAVLALLASAPAMAQTADDDQVQAYAVQVISYCNQAGGQAVQNQSSGVDRLVLALPTPASAKAFFDDAHDTLEPLLKSWPNGITVLINGDKPQTVHLVSSNLDAVIKGLD